MKMTRNERLYLNNLSKTLFGTFSKWQKLIEDGEVKQLIETMEDGTTRSYRGISRYTIDEVKKIMEDLHNEEQERKAKEINEKVVEEVKEDVSNKT